jgi:hypothetical protein
MVLIILLEIYTPKVEKEDLEGLEDQVLHALMLEDGVVVLVNQ